MSVVTSSISTPPQPARPPLPAPASLAGSPAVLPPASVPRVLLAFHLLSLDAVSVALVWQHALGQALRLPPTLPERLALGLSVWAVYLLDRQLDASRHDPGSPATHRHTHHHTHARAFLVLLVGVFVALFATLPFLTLTLLLSGVALAFLTALYLYAVQRIPPLLQSGSKELLIGLVFAAGCALHTLPHVSPTTSLGVIVLIGLLFTLNCLLISHWERPLDLAQSRPALSPRTTPLLRPLTYLLALVGLLWALLAATHLLPAFHAHGLLGLSLTSAALLLLALDLHASAHPYSTLQRINADLALLTPLFFLPLLNR